MHQVMLILLAAAFAFSPSQEILAQAEATPPPIGLVSSDSRQVRCSQTLFKEQWLPDMNPDLN